MYYDKKLTNINKSQKVEKSFSNKTHPTKVH